MDDNLWNFLHLTTPPRLDINSNIIVFYGKRYETFLNFFSRWKDDLRKVGRNLVAEDGTVYMFMGPSSGTLCGKSIKAYIISHEFESSQ